MCKSVWSVFTTFWAAKSENSEVGWFCFFYILYLSSNFVNICNDFIKTNSVKAVTA